MPRFFLNHRLNVILGADKDNPHGRVVQLGPNQGEPGQWVEVDDKDEALLAHPTIAGLLPRDSAESKRREAIYKAEMDHKEAIDEANHKYAQAMAEINATADDGRAKEGEDWAKRRDAALSRGQTFNEPHPDPEQQRANTLTAGSANPQIVSTETMRQADWPDKDQPTVKNAAASPAPAARGPQAADSDGRRAGEHAGSAKKD